MKVIIAGSRTFNGRTHDTLDLYGMVKRLVQESGFDVTEVVCGGAQGIDKVGERWALVNHIPIKYFLPDWERFGKKAGPIRNREMAQYADAAIILWDGKSRGTRNMLDEAHGNGLLMHWETIKSATAENE